MIYSVSIDGGVNHIESGMDQITSKFVNINNNSLI